MHVPKIIKSALALFMIFAIGVMEYAIVGDSASSFAFSKEQTIKKDKSSQDLVIARNLQVDDDDDDNVIRYISHGFHPYDLPSRFGRCLSPVAYLQASFACPALHPNTLDIYQRTRSYRI